MAACSQRPAAAAAAAASASCVLLSLALLLASQSSQRSASAQAALGGPRGQRGPVPEGQPGLNAGEGRGRPAGRRLRSTVPVYWSSDEHGGHVADADGDAPAHARGAVLFVGLDGMECRAGAVCSFDLLVRRPARWAAGTPHRRRDFMAALSGPAKALATVEEMTPMDGSRFRFSFQVWDKGVYKVSVANSCGMLQWRSKASSSGNPQRSDLASWVLNITNPDAHGLQGRDPVPCEGSSVQGRWLLVGGEYRWVQFPCTGTVPVEDWIPELNKAGIKEINFIGDSHNRQLAHHLYYLTSGKRLDPHEVKSHLSRTLMINHTSGASLVLSINFIKGIYASNKKFHCSMRHRTSEEPVWPSIPRTADVYLLTSGSWTGLYCKEPEMAFAAYFPDFLEWATTSIRAREKESAPLLLYRTAPPSFFGSFCNRISNVFINFANKLAKEVAASQNFLTFDAHEVEGPRYTEHCGGGHFSCDDREGKVIGDVGVGDVTAFVHFLLRYYHR